MPTFIYKARNVQGREVSGTLEARNPNDLAQQLAQKGFKVIYSKKVAAPFKLPGSTGIKSKDIALFTRQFATMTAAGLPLLQCLDILVEQTDNPNFRTVLQDVSSKIQGGRTLYEALSNHPKVFDGLYCHMVQAGEAGGILEGILLRLAEYRESYERLKRKIKKALTYPAMVMFVAVVVVWALLTFVVPVFAEMFTSSGAELPAPTRIVMDISNFLQSSGWIIVVAAVGTAIGISQYYKTPNGRYQIDKIMLKAPIFGDLIRKSSVARFSQTLGTLTKSGVPIIDALRVTSSTAGNKVLELGILKVIDSLSGGNNIADPLRETGVFPPMVIQMIGVGEKTGELSEMLIKISEFYSEEVDAAVDGLTSLIEPLIIVFLGVVIGGILVAMYLPMFDLANTVQ